MNMRNHGYIALITAIILCLIVTALSVTLSASGFSTRMNVLDAESKKISEQLAEGCLEKALIEIKKNSSYSVSSPGVCIAVVGDCSGLMKCKICEVSTSGTDTTIKIRAVYNNMYTNTTAVVTPASESFIIHFRKQVPVYTGGSCPVP